MNVSAGFARSLAAPMSREKLMKMVNIVRTGGKGSVSAAKLWAGGEHACCSLPVRDRQEIPAGLLRLARH